jgi:hypothetical protein
MYIIYIYIVLALIMCGIFCQWKLSNQSKACSLILPVLSLILLRLIFFGACTLSGSLLDDVEG